MNSVLPLRSSSTLSLMARRLPKYLLIALALYWGAMFVATHIPGDALSEQKFGIDKVAHFGAYAALAWLAALALRTMGWLNWKTALATFFVAITYGAIDELLQPYFHRNADVADWLADAVGAAFGLIAFYLMQPLLRRVFGQRLETTATRPPATP